MSKKVGRPPKISGDPKNFGRPPKISGDPQKFPATPKNFRRRPKISGDPQKFPATTKNFRRPPKISGDDQKFPATPENFRRRLKRPQCRAGRKCYFLSVESVEMHPIERASRCSGKVRIWVILGWDRLFDQK